MVVVVVVVVVSWCHNRLTSFIYNYVGVCVFEVAYIKGEMCVSACETFAFSSACVFVRMCYCYFCASRD